MKRVYFALLTALACMLSASPALAQSELKVTFHTNFAFAAGAAILPAGSYSLTDMGNNTAILSAAAGGKSAVIVLTRVTGLLGTSKQASVTFAQRGGRYVLDTVNLRDGMVVRVNPLAGR